jgi:hypothetical protein
MLLGGEGARMDNEGPESLLCQSVRVFQSVSSEVQALLRYFRSSH